MGHRSTTSLRILALVIFLSCIARAQADDEFLKGELFNARQQLHRQHPELSASELHRMATVMVRSNRLQFAIMDAFTRDDVDRGIKLLDQFPGGINQLKSWDQPVLPWAISQRRAHLAEELLKNGANPNIGGNYGLPLFQALGQKNWKLAAQLIDAGANPSATNQSGETPLTMFCYAGDDVVTNAESLAIGRELLARGANPLATSRRYGTESILDDLLMRGVISPLCDFVLTNCKPAHRTAQGQTALHVAVIHSDTNAVEKLLTHGFDIDQTNDFGLTPLQMAAGSVRHDEMLWGTSRTSTGILSLPRSRTIEIAEYLMQKGATVDVGSMSGLGLTNTLTSVLATNRNLVNWHDSNGRTPLHYAMVAPNPAAATILLQAGADTRATTTTPFPSFARGTTVPSGTTPLHLAASYSSPEVVTLLLKAKANIAAIDALGNTPLHLAAAQLGSNLTALLVAGAPLDLTNNAGKTSLRVAVESGNADHVRELLRAGANPNIATNGYTLLHLAAERGAANVVRVLLANKFKVDSRDILGRTPFMRAIMARQVNAATALLGAGANINAHDKQGNTALHLIAAESYDDAYFNAELRGLKGIVQNALDNGGSGAVIANELIKMKLLSPPPSTSTNGSVTAWLLKHDADVNATNTIGATALHALCSQKWARYNDSIKNRFDPLLKAGARVDVPDIAGLTPLHLASLNLSPKTLDELLLSITNVTAPRDTKGRTPLLYAIDEMNVNDSSRAAETISVLIRHEPVKETDSEGRTALHAVVQRAADNPTFAFSAVDLWKELVTAGADVNARDKRGRAPVHYFAGNPKFLLMNHPEWLLDKKWDYTIRDNDGQPAIHLLARSLETHNSGHVDFLRQLLRANTNLVNLTNATGDTPLYVAITAEKHELAKALVELGADPRVKNANGDSAYVLAAKKETLGWIDPYVLPRAAEHPFLASIAYRDFISFEAWLAAEPRVVSITNHQGLTPLLVATDQLRYSKGTNFVARLLDAGAPLDSLSALRLKRNADFDRLFATFTNAPRSWTFEAVACNNAHALKKLVAAGAKIDEADDEGHSLIFRAAHHKEQKIKEWLEQQNCKRTIFDAVIDHNKSEVAQFLENDPSLLDRTNAQGRSLLMRATAIGELDIVSLLLSKKPRLDFKTPEGWTALHIAAATNAVEIGEKLIAAGCNLTNFASGSMAPLHIAAARGSTEFVELLLRHGAPVNQQSTDERYSQNTALHWAADYGHTNIIALLLKNGADTEARNNQDDTPEDMAKSRRRWGFSWPSELRLRDPIVTEESMRVTLALLQHKP